MVFVPKTTGHALCSKGHASMPSLAPVAALIGTATRVRKSSRKSNMTYVIQKGPFNNPDFSVQTMDLTKFTEGLRKLKENGGLQGFYVYTMSMTRRSTPKPVTARQFLRNLLSLN